MMPQSAKIVDQVPDGRFWCSRYGSGECCKKHTEICGMHGIRVSVNWIVMSRNEQWRAVQNAGSISSYIQTSTHVDRVVELIFPTALCLEAETVVPEAACYMRSFQDI